MQKDFWKRRNELSTRLFSLKSSKEFMEDDPKTVKEVRQIREEIKALEIEALNPMERARALIDKRSEPTVEEIWGIKEVTQ
jgi:hypothetical protein